MAAMSFIGTCSNAREVRNVSVCLICPKKVDDVGFREVCAFAGLAESANLTSVIGSVVGDVAGDLAEFESLGIAVCSFVANGFVRVFGLNEVYPGLVK